MPLAALIVVASPLAITAQPPAQTGAPSQTGLVIVLDAAHGGTDTGARGQGALAEKDIVLDLTRAVRAELERQGFHVVMTRNDDSNPTYDDRAALANAQRDAIFITFHISSTGTFGTARAYYCQLPNSLSQPGQPITNATATPEPSQMKVFAPPVPLTSGLTPWDEAQKQFAEASHHFADILQGELSQRFPGSPATPSAAAVRGLRSVAAPAIAVEISSVGVPDPAQLSALANPLATSIVRGIVAFRPMGSAGAK